MADFFVGIDLGGTNIKIGCFDAEVNLIARTSTPTGVDMGPEFVAEQIVEGTRQLLAEAKVSIDTVAGIGIGTPGPADYPRGIIIKSPNMPKFKNTPLRDMVAEKLGKPAILENDANVACWGEFAIGAGRDINDMVFFTLGTGIGGGIVSNGELVRGADGNAAELGHLLIYPDGRLCGCGQKGCVEAYASANSTAARAREAVEAGGQSSLKKVLEQNGEITCKDVFEHSAQGDALAKEITEGTAKALGLICVFMLHTTGPKKIVFAGGMIAAGDLLLESIRRHFKEQIWNLKQEPLEICFATLGEDAGIIGAAALAIHEKNLGRL